LIDHCLEQLQSQCGDGPNAPISTTPLLRQWLAICLGHIWENNESARWIGTRNTAHEKLFVLLDDPVPEVRAAAVYALGTFINSAIDRTDHANALDHNIAITLINKVLNDSSPLVRKELLVALHWLVLIFESCFAAIIYHKLEEERMKELVQNSQMSASNIENSLNVGTPPQGLRKVASRDRLSAIAINKFLSVPISITPNSQQTFGYIPGEAVTPPNYSNTQNIAMKRVNSSNSLHNYQTNSGAISGSAIPNVFSTIWKAITAYANDPFPEVATMAQTVIDEMKARICQPSTTYDSLKESHSEQSLSEPNSPNNLQSYMSESPTSNAGHTSRNTTPIRESLNTSNRMNMSSPFPHMQHYKYTTKRYIFGREPSVSDKSQDGNTDETSICPRHPLISTSFIEWCTKHFSQPYASNMNYTESTDFERMENNSKPKYRGKCEK
ncbi:unnamed protein product, partial [Oppiella nova]